MLGKNSIHIVPSAIGFIPDIYENEVKSLVWAKQNPDSAGTLAATTPSNSYPTKKLILSTKKSASERSLNSAELPAMRESGTGNELVIQ